MTAQYRHHDGIHERGGRSGSEKLSGRVHDKRLPQMVGQSIRFIERGLVKERFAGAFRRDKADLWPIIGETEAFPGAGPGAFGRAARET